MDNNILKKIQIGVSEPKLLFRKTSQATNFIRHKSKHNSNGIDITTADWDTLIILDACRYDAFERNSDLDGDLSAVVSRGSATPEFLRGNFDGKSLLDTVYLTSNPMLHRIRESIDVKFHAVKDVWSGDGWDDELGTVKPETITEIALHLAEDYPHKRLIVHYMQPHYPFIGSSTEFDKGFLQSEDEDDIVPWMKVMTGEVDNDLELLWNAYIENLKYCLPHVNRLISGLRGKTVVTADHGNMFGERARPIPIREWGHPPGIYTEELVKVPWLECPVNGTRPEIIAEESTAEQADETEADVADRLADLGYIE